MGRTEIEKRRAAVRERVRKWRAAAKERIGQTKRIEGTLATTNDNTTLPGNLQTRGTMVVKLDFCQPKKSNSSRKRERLLADRRRKAVEKLQDENKNLKRKPERLYKQLQRKKKKNSSMSSRTTSLSASSASGFTSESSSFQNHSEATTPRSKADAEIRPCDGVGGTSKRLADEAVKQEKVTIQDASDFLSGQKKITWKVRSRFFREQSTENF